MKKLSISIILISFILSSMVFAGVATPRSSGSRDTKGVNYRTINGTVVSLDQKKTEFVMSDSSGIKITVRAKGADFVNVDKRGSFDDLRKNIGVRVYGREISRGLVEADLVVVGSSGGGFSTPTSTSDIGKIITLRGKVERVDERQGRINLQSTRGLMEVLVGKETDIRDFGRKRSLSDIHSGTRITVTGPLESARKMVAHSIDIGGLDSGRDVIDTALSGTVVRGTSVIDRNIVVKTPGGDKRVQVPATSDVRIDGRTSSVHNIKIRDHIQAVGRWSGDVFVASQVNISRSDFSKSGMVISPGSNRIRVRIGPRQEIINISTAVIKLNGRTVTSRELKYGDQVKITGSKRGNSFYADTIEIEKRRR